MPRGSCKRALLATQAPACRAGLPACGLFEVWCLSLVSPLLIQLWQAALSTLNPNPTDSCPLYLNYATVAALPSRVSRHNSPSAAHFVTRLVRTCLPPGTHRCILVSAEGHPPTIGERVSCLLGTQAHGTSQVDMGPQPRTL